MQSLRVNLAERSYDIAITNDLAGVGAFARARCVGQTAFVISDQNVAVHAAAVRESLAAAGFRAAQATRPPGEAQKSLSVAAELYDGLIAMPADRKTLVVAVGGGVIGDLAGFVAATYARGLPLLMVPTTLLAMVDSAVGGKVAVNHPKAKNMIGVFHQPIGVWIALDTLASLPEREYRSGLAEVVKYGVILDEAFFTYLEANAAAALRRDPNVVAHLVRRSCELKAAVVEKDERDETGLRAVLNYGHTFAHAFETAAGYGGWLHGEAVSAGMVCASRLAERRGLIAKELTARQVRLLETFGLPIAPRNWDIEALLQTMRADKKAVHGRLRFILPRRLGEVALFDDVPENDVRAVLMGGTEPTMTTLQLTSTERDWFALHVVPGIGPRLAAALLKRFGSTAAILTASAAELAEIPHLPSATASALQKALGGQDVETELALLDKHGVGLIRLGSPEYPPALATIAVPPRFLFVRGQLQPSDANAIAIVGSRQCTSYGRRVAERLAGDLVQAGYTVVSGLARGIDGCAHRGALDGKGRTLAILAGGLAKIYPPEHAELADAVAASGALISESAMRMEPMPGMFPARNRIISGLCRAVVVVEANEKSGALITARHAAEEGREVFAVPGPVDSGASAGTLKLLRQGAKLIRHARDLLDDLKTLAPLFGPAGNETPIAPPPIAQPPPGLDETQCVIWGLLGETRNVDDLARQMNLNSAALSSVLMTMELKRIVRRLPGNLYERY